MDRVKAAKVFIAIVEQGSFIKAADKLDMSRSMVTRYLAEMEHWAGSQLLLRSTRKLSLTDVGEKVLAQCYALEKIDTEVRFTSATNSEASGTIRIGASRFVADKLLIPFVQHFLTTYPKVAVDIQVSNQLANLVSERLDLAIRITNSLDPNIIARKFGVLHSVICASKLYLSNKGTPTTISQLAHHNCLTYSFFGKNVWEFTLGEAIFSSPVDGNLSANDPSLLLKAALSDTGISMQPKYAVHEHIKSGALVQLLPEYTPQTLGIYGIYKSRKYMTKALRTFIDEFSLYIDSLDL